MLRVPQHVAANILIVCLNTSPAQAAASRGGECVWKSISAQTRSAALEAGLIGGPASLMSGVPKSELIAVEKKCGLTEGNGGVFHRTEAGYMLQVLAETWLKRNTNIAPEALDRGWSKLGARSKGQAKEWAIYLIIEPRTLDEIYSEFVKLVPLNGSVDGSLIKPRMITYIQGRALQDTYNPEL